MSSRSPNAEQREAISRPGGVLLSAGAGSGKTFVIIEHIIFKLQELRKLHSLDFLENNITGQLSQITLMTFTKKATGEMSIRLTRRIEELAQSESIAKDEKKYWELIYKNISSLKILTIHGLCHHLLRAGFWPDFPLEIELLDSMAHRRKIKTLFDQWYELNEANLKPQFLAHTRELFIAIEEIFKSPELRILWEAPQTKSNSVLELDYFFSEWIKLRNFSVLFKTQLSYSGDKKKSDKKIFQGLEKFSILVNNVGPINATNFADYSHFYSELGRFPNPSKDMTDLETCYRDELQTLQVDLKSWGEDLQNFPANFASYQEWAQILLGVFQYINSNYKTVPGFSFSDLEYYVHKGLEHQSALKKIHESCSYFIVDEFQDTSFVQFEIIRKLINNDFSKLYVVGDRKQAIYGFRGGELQVFQDCEKLMKNGNLFLKSNYRSKKNIIEFNNSFFSDIFPLGFKFEDRDLLQTKMEEQLVPETSAGAIGEVYSLVLDVQKDLKAKDLDITESLLIADEIQKLLKEDSIETICVLYRKLRPSYALIDQLKERNISFVAQIKISFQDDPLISFFRFIVEYVLNFHDERQKTSSFFKLRALCEILTLSNLTESRIDDFIESSKLFGIKNSFMKLFLDLGISTSFYEQNFKLIMSICDLGQNDFLQIYHLLKESDDNYSTELVSGGNGKRIYLMTAHASKGLEFDAVVLGGVHTNGAYLGMRDIVGKMPNSFRYKKSYDQKKFNKSPTYFLEAEILKQKNFSESKRLLYVACTRAISKLVWVDLRNGDKELIADQSCWIKALRMSNAISVPTKLEVTKVVQDKDVSFIQKDSLGILIHERPNSFGVTSELSVTRLATLAECPFKFYLQNICKINHEEKFYLESEEDQDVTFHSSKARGTNIHLQLSKLLKGPLIDEYVAPEFKDMFSWVDSLRVKYLGYKCSSEETMKFSFFNNMISGTPDAYFMSENELIIWDFKTGLRSEADEQGYWFQLMCYAFGIGKIYPIVHNLQIELCLLYVDEKKCITKKMTYEDISQELFLTWKKTESLYQVNHKHCSQCEYSSICNKSCL